MENLLKDFTDEIRPPQRSPQKSNITSEATEFDDHTETYSNDTDSGADINSEEVDSDDHFESALSNSNR